MVSTCINRPRKPLWKNLRKLKRVQKQARKKNKPLKIGNVADPELVHKGILKKRMTSPRANITLSGKKKRKIMKQLRRNQKEKVAMDVDVKPKKIKAKNVDEDVEMTE